MECTEILDNYIKFLSRNLIELKEKGYCEIGLPFPKPNGDSIILRIVKLSEDIYLISDEGFMDMFLFENGLDLWKLSSEKASDTFKYLRKRYGIKNSGKPYIVIEATKENLYERIFEMSNIMNELASLKLLTHSIQFDYFKDTVKLFFEKNRLNFKYKPDRLQFEWSEQNYSFDLDFLYYKKELFIKLLSSKTIIKSWALNFRIIKEFYETQNQDIILWTIFNEKAGITSEKIQKWFQNSVDNVIGWYTQKERIPEILEKSI